MHIIALTPSGKEFLMSQSEVQRLLAEIYLEYQAAWNGLSGLAQGTAQHDFINAKLENMEYARQALESIVGEDEAARLVVEQMNREGKGR